MNKNEKVDPGTVPYLPIADGNFLVVEELKSTQKKGRDDDDNYYIEVNRDG